MRILIAGATGVVGARLTEHLLAAGHDVVAASRGSGVDVLTGSGLAEAMTGVDVVVDALNVATRDAQASTQFFETTTRRLTDAETEAGVAHHVLLSIVGIERVPGNGYYVGKLAQEALVEASARPFTIVRATQFFEFVASFADRFTVDGEVRLPRTLIRPLAVDELAEVLAELSTGSPLNGVLEVAGPEQAPVSEFVRRLLDKNQDSRRVIEDDASPAFGATTIDALAPAGEFRATSTGVDDWRSRAAT